MGNETEPSTKIIETVAELHSVLMAHGKWLTTTPHNSSTDGSERRIFVRTWHRDRYGGEGGTFALPLARPMALSSSRDKSREFSEVLVTSPLFKQLTDDLKLDTSRTRRLSDWPIDRTFVFFDISDFTTHPDLSQLMIINSLARLSLGAQQIHEHADLESMICIGDGYIFVFDDEASAVRYACCLAASVELAGAKKEIPVQFHFRIGVHRGPVHCFWDPARSDWNYIGSAINGAQRVMAAIGKEMDDVIFVSNQVRDELAAYSEPDLLDHMRNRGRHRDKHDEMWRVYEIEHTWVLDQSIPAPLASLSFPDE